MDAGRKEEARSVESWLMSCTDPWFVGGWMSAQMSETSSLTLLLFAHSWTLGSNLLDDGKVSSRYSKIARDWVRIVVFSLPVESGDAITRKGTLALGFREVMEEGGQPDEGLRETLVVVTGIDLR